MRSPAIAGLGGLILGHLLWLLPFSAINAARAGDVWMLVVAAVLLIGSAVAGYRAWRSYQRKDMVRAAFLAALPVCPVFFTTLVLGANFL